MKGRCTWCWGTTDEAYCCAGCQHDHNEGRTPPWDARAKAALAAEREAHAAIERNDARHASELAAVRKRAEHAEAEVSRLREQVQVASDALDACARTFQQIIEAS